jgi:O-antigen/teichoic acid export membrane protein
MQMVISSAIVSIILWKQTSWRPTYSFSFYSFKKLFDFGYKLFFSALLALVAKNMYSASIAKFYAATVAGFYYLVEKMLDIIMGQLVYAVQNVTYPALSSIQDDSARLKEAYRKVLIIITFIVFPAVLFLAALAEPIFVSIAPEKWWPAIQYFQLMCIVFVLYPLHAINLNILKVKGRSDLFLKLEVVKVLISMFFLILTISHGVESVLIGQVITSIIAYYFNSYHSVKLVGYSLRQQVLDFLPYLISSFLVASLVFYLQKIIDYNPFAEVLFFSIFAFALYYIISIVLNLKAPLLIRSAIDGYRSN